MQSSNQWNLKDLHGENSITQEHIDNNAAVRKMLVERGIIPENLLAAEDVKKVERRLESEQKKVLGKKKQSVRQISLRLT